MQAGFQESMVTEKLVRSGYDPRIIKSETELKVILNRIDASKKQSKEQKDKAMKQLADIMDMKGRKYHKVLKSWVVKQLKQRQRLLQE